MKKKLTILVGLLLLVLITCAWVYFRFFFSLFDSCHEDKIAEVQSLTGKYVAREFRLNCGATSDWATEFNVKNTVTGGEQRVLSLKGDSIDSCSLTWIDGTTLKIKCDSAGFVYNSKNEFEGVKIVFEPTSLGQPTQ